MKFSCEKDKLLEAINVTSKAASSKSTIASLEGLLLELNNDVLSITGYDLEIGIRTEFPIIGGENGSTVINAKVFGDIIRKMPNGVIEISVDDNKIASIVGGSSTLSIPCMKAEEYPPVPQVIHNKGITLPQPVLKSMINQTKYAISVNDSKPAFTGCKFEIIDNVLSIVAFDGVRIALRQEPVTSDNIDFIVPGKTLEELTHILSDDTDSSVTISIENNQISFEVGSYTMISRLINGDFWDYRKYFNVDRSVYAEIKCSDMIGMLDRALTIINEKNKIPLRCEFNDGTLSVTANTTMGAINDKINIKYSGPGKVIGFNARFLMDAFRACSTDTIKLSFSNSEVTPVIISPIEGEEFMFLLVPMRLR